MGLVQTLLTASSAVLALLVQSTGEERGSDFRCKADPGNFASQTFRLKADQAITGMVGWPSSPSTSREHHKREAGWYRVVAVALTNETGSRFASIKIVLPEGVRRKPADLTLTTDLIALPMSVGSVDSAGAVMPFSLRFGGDVLQIRFGSSTASHTFAGFAPTFAILGCSGTAADFLQLNLSPTAHPPALEGEPKPKPLTLKDVEHGAAP